MKRRQIPGVILVVGALVLSGGCASSKAPCPIIPAQLELAEERTRTIEEETHEASKELDRIQNNLARIQDNIDKLEAEKETLLELVGGGDEGGEKQ